MQPSTFLAPPVVSRRSSTQKAQVAPKHFRPRGSGDFFFLVSAAAWIPSTLTRSPLANINTYRYVPIYTGICQSFDATIIARLSGRHEPSLASAPVPSPDSAATEVKSDGASEMPKSQW